MDGDEALLSSLALRLRDLQDATSQANLAMARRMGMSATDAAAIEHISLAPEAIGPAELSARLGVTRSSATEIVDRLVAAGHLERRRDEGDGRRVRLIPTATARDRVRAEIAPLVAAIDDATRALSPREKDAAARFLAEVAAAHRRFAVGSD